ncbi:MAG: insulinase family protein [Gemmatimonadetes bacterium]|nr:insulinase family protein [Gemmatimonadota bacterium]
MRFLVTVLFATALQAQQAELAKPLPSDTQTTAGVLPNGIKYYIRVNHRPEHRAELRLAVNTGSVLEADNQRGIAHFVEHMAFNGTKNFPRQALVSYLETIGMRFGPDINAYTSFDETVYMLTVPTDTAKFMETGFQILQDWAQGLLFDSSEVDKERGVVVEEWRLGRGAEARMFDKQMPVLFQGSRYAQRLPIGLKEQLETFTAADLRKFYQAWYRPDLMSVIAVGDFDKATVERLIKSNFSGVPRAPASAPARPIYPVPDHAQTLVSTATDQEATDSRVAVYFKLPLRHQRTIGDYRQGLVENLFNSMLNNRFFEITQKPDAPFVYASSGQGRMVRSGEVYVLSGAMKDGGILPGLDAMMVEAERVARHGFTSTELARHKADMLRGLEVAFNERDKTNSVNYASELARAFLEAEPTPGIEAEYGYAKRYLPGVTLEEINQLARAWITDKNRVVLVNAPDKAGLATPTDPDLLAVFNGIKGQTIEAYQDVASDQPLVPSVPRGSAIVEENVIAEIGAREWKLANGVRVVLKPTDFKNDEVVMSAWSPGGTSLSADSLFTPAMTAGMVVSQGGVGAFSLVDLQKQLSGKAVNVDPYISPLSEGFGGSASPRDLETLFQLVYLYFTSPRRDSSSFLALQQQADAMLENRSASPQAAFADTLQVTMAQHHARVRPYTAQLFKEMNLERSMAFYRDRFADASDFTFFFVGTFNVDSIKPLVETWLGGLPSVNRKEAWKDEGIRPPTGVVKRVVKKGVEPKSQTTLRFTGAFNYTSGDRYAIRSLAEVMQIRLRDKLREQLGGTYSVGVSGSGSREPYPRFTVSVDFGSAPERVNELVAQVFAEIKLLQDSGATAGDVVKVKELQRRGRETSLRQNGYWAGQLEGYYRDGADPRDILSFDKLVEGLTPAVIKNAASKYLRTDNYVQVSLFPENMPTP